MFLILNFCKINGVFVSDMDKAIDVFYGLLSSLFEAENKVNPLVNVLVDCVVFKSSSQFGYI